MNYFFSKQKDIRSNFALIKKNYTNYVLYY